jgi:hypothetical protein
VYSGIRSSRGTVLVLGLGDRYNSCHVPSGEARRLFTWRELCIFVYTDVARITERSRAAEPLSFSDTSDSAVNIFASGNSSKLH